MKKHQIRFFLFFLVTSFCFLQADEAYVDLGVNLSQAEQKYILQRDPSVQIAIKDFIGYSDVPKEFKLPRIAFAFSGGGYRSMICSCGFMNGANTIGLDMTASYMAALSGGTWFLVHFLTRNLSPQDFKAVLQKRVATSFFDPKTLDLKAIIKKLEQKGLSVHPVDLWGALLADRLMGDLGTDNAFNWTFDKIRKLLVSSAKYPFPLVNSVITDLYPYKMGYYWADMNPFDVRMIGLNSSFREASIPTYAFTSSFSGGKNSGPLAAEESLSFFMGLLGSPYNLSLGEIFYDIAYHSENETFKNWVAWFIEKFDLYNMRFLNSPEYNFTYKIASQPFVKFEKTNFTDAGITFVNIPFPALIKQERKNDIIIVCDASTDAGDKGYPEMLQAKDYAKTRGIKFPPATNPQIINSNLAIFQDENDSTVPVVVYFSNPDKTSTLKFDYTESEFNKLHDTMKSLVMQNKNALVDVIKSKIFDQEGNSLTSLEEDTFDVLDVFPNEMKKVLQEIGDGISQAVDCSVQ